MQPLNDAAKAGRAYPIKEDGDPPALLTLARAAALLRRAGFDEEERVWGCFALGVWEEEVCWRLFRKAQRAYGRDTSAQEVDVDHADCLLYEVLRRLRRSRSTERESAIRAWHAAWDEYFALRQARARAPPPPPPEPRRRAAPVTHEDPIDGEDDDWYSSDGDWQSCASQRAPSPAHSEEVCSEVEHSTRAPSVADQSPELDDGGSSRPVNEVEGYRHPIMDQWNREYGPDGVVEQATRRLWRERLARYSADRH